MPAPFSPIGLDHVVLRAADPEALVAFYVAALGCPVERRLDRIGLVQLRAGASLIDIVPRPADAPSGANLDHFCLRVEPFDPDRIRAHLAGLGVEAGPPAERYGADGTGQSIYFTDPEGNSVELKGPPHTPPDRA